MNTKKFEILLTQELSLDEQVILLKEFSLEHLTAGNLRACAQAILDQAIKIPLLDEYTVDLVGTGGDGLNTFNVSTTAALVAAAAGVKVAKHGNRSVTSRSGSFDVLQALGIPIAENAEEANKQLTNMGITFLFAPFFHPVLKRLSDARQVLAKQQIKTIFNIIGPMVNPMQVKRQAIGVFKSSLIKPYIESLQARGMKKSLVFHGQGMDELSLTGVNQVAMLTNDAVHHFDLDPVCFGLKRCELTSLQSGTPLENAQITVAILKGEDQSAKRDIVLLNAAAAITVSTDENIAFADAIAMAAEAIDSGRASALLEKLSGNKSPRFATLTDPLFQRGS